MTIEPKGGDRTMDETGPPGRCRTKAFGGSPPPAVDASVPQARHAVRDLLVRQGVPVSDDVAEGLLLIVSELVTNAVRHAAVLSPVLAVEIAVGPEWVRVSVEDSHPYRPTALEADHGQTGGRGLLLVREITRRRAGVRRGPARRAGGR